VNRIRALWQKPKLRFSEPSKFYKLAMEFCLEAGVLIAVFPLLDTIIQQGGSIQKVGWPLVVWSEGIAIGLFLIAVIMSKAVKDEE